MLSAQGKVSAGPVPHERKRAYFVIGTSDAMHAIEQEIALAARTSVNVLIRGERGTGKGLVAERIHAQGSRAGGDFVVADCNCLDELFTSQMFGAEAGSYTGAARTRKGLVEAASGGTLFIDEIEKLPLSQQGKLNRLLQDGQMRRLGGTVTKSVDARIIAASNADLESMVERGEFLHDLFDRLDGDTIHLPPLRDRDSDTDVLAIRFVGDWAREYGASFSGLTVDARAALNAYAWPGNVRELNKRIQKSVRNRVLRGYGDGPLELEDLVLPLLPAQNASGFVVPSKHQAWYLQGTYPVAIPMFKKMQGTYQLPVIRRHAAAEKELVYSLDIGEVKVVFLDLRNLLTFFKDTTQDFWNIVREIQYGDFNQTVKEPFGIYHGRSVLKFPGVQKAHVDYLVSSGKLPTLGLRLEHAASLRDKPFIVTSEVLDTLIAIQDPETRAKVKQKGMAILLQDYEAFKQRLPYAA